MRRREFAEKNVSFFADQEEVTRDHALVIGNKKEIRIDLQKFKYSNAINRSTFQINNTNSQEQVGKTVFFDIAGDFVCSNHITRIATDEAELLPEYLTAILNTYQRLKVFYSICTNWNNQSGVNADLLRKVTIPVPSISKQSGLAEEIGRIFASANALRQEANAELESAKREIEAILLGDAP